MGGASRGRAHVTRRHTRVPSGARAYGRDSAKTQPDLQVVRETCMSWYLGRTWTYVS